jgi:UDP-N-acetylmuramate dehydrogenase
MRLGGRVKFVQDIDSTDGLKEALEWARLQNLGVIMIGRGSNIIWRDEGFDGLLLVNKIMGYELVPTDKNQFILSVGAGENWDSVVARTVENGLTGIEALSLIPGTAGATPIQNVGAYGQEIAQVLVTVKVYDNQERKFSELAGADCQFGYRTSRFKTSDTGRFFITGLKLRLTQADPQPPFYPSQPFHLKLFGKRSLTSAAQNYPILINSPTMARSFLIHRLMPLSWRN